LAYAAVGSIDRAIQDDSRALELDRSFTAPALHRAAMYCRQRKFAEAQADLRQAEQNGANPAATHYTWALLHLGEGHQAAALASIERALSHQPDHAEARSLRDRLRPAL
jgi:tetratricopeptide (TPR) repeat protein